MNGKVILGWDISLEGSKLLKSHRVVWCVQSGYLHIFEGVLQDTDTQIQTFTNTEGEQGLVGANRFDLHSAGSHS